MRALVLAAVTALAASAAHAQSVTTSSSWTPIGIFGTPVAVGSTPTTTQLPSGGNVAWLCNIGNDDAYVEFGQSTSMVGQPPASPKTGTWLKQGRCGAYNLWPNGTASLVYTAISLVASQTGGGTSTSVTIETGTGTPPAF